MKELLNAAILPTLLRFTRWKGSSVSARGGTYAGVYLTAGKPFLGVQGRVNPRGLPLRTVVSLEGSPMESSDRWQLNADALHHFVGTGAPFLPYAGGGLCVVGTPDDDGASMGINLIGGGSFALGPLKGFAQLRVTIADGVHVSLTGGAVPPPSR